jgi:hypothetical protein
VGSEPHGIISQKITFITTAVRKSKPTEGKVSQYLPKQIAETVLGPNSAFAYIIT